MIDKLKGLLKNSITKVSTTFESTKENHVSPLDSKLYTFLKITRLHVIIPAIAITIVLSLAIEYWEYLALFLIGLILLLKWLTTESTESIDHIDRYIYIRDILFQSLNTFDSMIPIRSPQTHIDIVHIPECISEGRYAVYLYQLPKTTYEHTDKSLLDFAQKIIQANIDKQLNQYEELHADGSTYYNDLRTITLTNIVDMGTHYRLEILWVDDDKTYDVARKQLNRKDTINNADTKDEDF